MRKGKIRWGSVFVGAVGFVAELGDPHVLGFLPGKWSHAIAGAAFLAALVKKSILREEHER